MAAMATAALVKPTAIDTIALVFTPILLLPTAIADYGTIKLETMTVHLAVDDPPRRRSRREVPEGRRQPLVSSSFVFSVTRRLNGCGSRWTAECGRQGVRRAKPNQPCGRRALRGNLYTTNAVNLSRLIKLDEQGVHDSSMIRLPPPEIASHLEAAPRRAQRPSKQQGRRLLRASAARSADQRNKGFKHMSQG